MLAVITPLRLLGIVPCLLLAGLGYYILLALLFGWPLPPQRGWGRDV